jgi:hypothetical protein
MLLHHFLDSSRTRQPIVTVKLENDRLGIGALFTDDRVPVFQGLPTLRAGNDDGVSSADQDRLGDFKGLVAGTIVNENNSKVFVGLF